MRDKELCNLTVGSLLFSALKFYIIRSPTILLELFEEKTLLFRSVYLIWNHAMYQGPILPSQCCQTDVGAAKPTLSPFS